MRYSLLLVGLAFGCSSSGEMGAQDSSQTGDLPPSDLARRDSGTSDLTTADSATSDLATPDLETPDLATPDLAIPDLATPDLATRDLAIPDLAMPDLGASDLTVSDSGPLDSAMPDLEFPQLGGYLVVSQLSNGTAPVPIKVTPASPCSSPENVPVVVTEFVTPPGSVSSATLSYTYGGIGPILIPMAFAGTQGGGDLYTATIPGWPTALGFILYTITLQDHYGGSFVDPPNAQYEYEYASVVSPNCSGPCGYPADYGGTECCATGTPCMFGGACSSGVCYSCGVAGVPCCWFRQCLDNSVCNGNGLCM